MSEPYRATFPIVVIPFTGKRAIREFVMTICILGKGTKRDGKEKRNFTEQIAVEKCVCSSREVINAINSVKFYAYLATTLIIIINNY